MRKRLLLGLCAVLFGSASFAEQSPFAVGLSVGTLGAGIEGVYGINSKLNVRAAYHGFDYSTDIENDGANELDYKGDLELSNVGIGLDYHPWGGAFRLSAGVQVSDNRLQGSATCNRVAGCDFGDQANVVPNGSTATVDIDLGGTHPFVTIGWGNALSDGARLGFFADLGVMFQGTPTVDVVANCTAATQANCDNEAADEEQELQKEAEDFEAYPIVNLGMRFRFN